MMADETINCVCGWDEYMEPDEEEQSYRKAKGQLAMMRIRRALKRLEEAQV